MLGNYPIEVVLLATDLKASRDFYVQKIGLEIVRESENAVWFKCGNEGDFQYLRVRRVLPMSRIKRLGALTM